MARQEEDDRPSRGAGYALSHPAGRVLVERIEDPVIVCLERDSPLDAKNSSALLLRFVRHGSILAAMVQMFYMPPGSRLVPACIAPPWKNT